MDKQQALNGALAEVRAFQKVEEEKKRKRMANRPPMVQPNAPSGVNGASEVVGASELPKRAQARNQTTAFGWDLKEICRGGY